VSGVHLDAAEEEEKPVGMKAFSCLLSERDRKESSWLFR